VDTTAATFVADLSGFADQTLTVLASGYLRPYAAPFSTRPLNFGLIAVDAQGNVVRFQPVARVQFIHNSPDSAVSIADIYVDSLLTPFVDDLGFRDATAYLNVPAGTRKIDVAPGRSSSAAGAVYTQRFEFATGETYVLIASGVLDPDNFESNPDGVSTDFRLLQKRGAREFVDTQNGDVELFGVHGSPYASTVGVRTRTGTTLLDDVAYADLSDYVAISPTPYTLDVTGPNQTAVVARFAADLTGLTNRTVTVLASGFLTTGGDDPSGPTFRLMAALDDGTFVTFTPEQTPDGSTGPSVELTGFSATAEASSVVLTWRTLSDTNNRGFEVQHRRGDDGSHETIGFREGQGTTTATTRYRFRTDDLEPGTHTFRLNQIDTEGTATLSGEVQATVGLQSAYAWSKIIPNPIRRSGQITMQVRAQQDVTVELYDVLGRRIQELRRGVLTPGTTHCFTVDTAALPCGIYLLCAQGETFRATQRVTVVQ
jgi:hypothetical protein